MKIAIFFLTGILISVSSFAQSGYFRVNGKVIDAVTKNPMQAASVFAQNTTTGTATDINGNFTIPLPNGGYDLVITFTGYETVSRRITTADAVDNNIVFEMRQKENSLEDVVIKASNEVKEGWEKYGVFFLENFIGKTENSKWCTIINKEVLKFYFYRRSNRLKVLATAPVEMENLAMGYKIKYTLDSFTHEYGTQAGIYTGYPLFEEMQPTDSIQAETWQENRLIAYQGSMLHFMRSVYHKTLKEEDFEIQFVAKKNDLETAVKLTDFYRALNYSKNDSTNVVDIIPNQQHIAVLYSGEDPEPGYIALNKDTPAGYQLSVITIAGNEGVSIEQNGYHFDQDDITLTGYWSWDKMADMLPYDYIPPAPEGEL